MARPKGKPGKVETDSSAEEKGNGIVAPEEPSWDNIKHFTPREFTCKCDGYCDHPDVISLGTVAKLDRIRDLIGKPVEVISGTRCERHNNKVAGRVRSAHLAKDGCSRAVDVRCPDAAYRFAFLTAALPLFNRIGIGKDFIHVDDDPELPPGMIWTY
ncbi:MAG: peptidase M15 [Desulfomonile tiedjei]|nr:peptidase M15 [Desulfomonile tiedjei]